MSWACGFWRPHLFLLHYLVFLSLRLRLPLCCRNNDGISLFFFLNDSFELFCATGLFSFFGCVRIFCNVSCTTFEEQLSGYWFFSQIFSFTLKASSKFFQLLVQHTGLWSVTSIKFFLCWIGAQVHVYIYLCMSSMTFFYIFFCAWSICILKFSENDFWKFYNTQRLKCLFVNTIYLICHKKGSSVLVKHFAWCSWLQFGSSSVYLIGTIISPLASVLSLWTKDKFCTVVKNKCCNIINCALWSIINRSL